MNAVARRLLNASRISRDLASVTHYAGDEVAPSSVGMSPTSVETIWRSVERLYQTGTHPGMQLHVRHRGETVIHRAIGHASGNGPHDPKGTPVVPMTTETPICYFSASKAVTALLIHILAEQGRINLLDPVSVYCPEFGRKGKRTITIHQILSHRGGIPAIPRDTPLDTLWDSDAIWELLCDQVPVEVDGAKVAYHAITGGYVLQRVLETVTGDSIEAFLDRHIRQPMGMTWFTYGIQPDRLNQLATNYATGPTPVFPVSWVIKRALGGDMATIEDVVNDPRFQEAVIPAGNLCGTAEEMGRFFQMMLNGGVWEGRRICDPVTVRRAIQQYGSLQIDRTMMVPMRFSAGFMLGGDPVGLFGPNSREAFGHIGLINKLCWADASRDIAVSLVNTGIPIVGHHLPALARFVMATCREFPRLPEERRPLAA
ncbi:CubicO group peptidase (beta-lactamase class C family) [Tamilnaduibacter salinus]|uniref:CubicO group peptidase (Beta-lactamase class C family) n=1 Tax=Tamilnaduibacter salinus TaxID=1484056 RepID=A0A2A2I1T6_9GAMM|nr:serine hydrolase domain-containing protein [Tamilnaduibacter salinus]PAV25050.1 serine hydrolase [Tamilnaduibacter salinus]PVY77410.1 CubicO group peptidase (beta-lactamase class C family) [Tamilnaduibacter salinus]